jgi:hypothetical protein
MEKPEALVYYDWLDVERYIKDKYPKFGGGLIDDFYDNCINQYGDISNGGRMNSDFAYYFDTASEVYAGDEDKLLLLTDLINVLEEEFPCDAFVVSW